MFDEDELLPISGLQHLVFCERQWALIHIERLWEENRLTAEGRVLHEKVHEAGSETRPGVRTARGLGLQCLRLGLAGQADAVEFYRDDSGAAVSGQPGFWRIFPVEYKRGRPKPDASDKVQLCAQALCLEEMLQTRVASGALFYGVTRRRLDVIFDAVLRARTESLAARMHEMYLARETPRAIYMKKCESCSLIGQCMPRILSKPPGLKHYFATALGSGGESG